MNKQRFFLRLILISALFTIASCSDEPVDSVLAAQLDEYNSNNSGGNNNGGAVTATGDYLPLALNNVWNYQINNATTIKDYKINAIESIEGMTYYRLNHAITSLDNPLISESDVTVHLRKLNGVYYQRTYVHSTATATSPGITIDPFELIILKDFMNVGESFTQTVNTNVTTTFMGVTTTSVQPATYVIKMIARDLTITIGSTTYTNVIETKTTDESGGYSYDWFSKDIGWIKSVDYDEFNAPTGDGLNLTTYTLY